MTGLGVKKYQNKKRYIRIPKNENRDKFRQDIYRDLKNIHRTKKPVKIVKVRVSNENIEQNSK